jgi:hypothetical protein
VARAGFYDIDTQHIVNFHISLIYPLLSRQVYLTSFSLMSEYAYGDGVVGYVTSFFSTSLAPFRRRSRHTLKPEIWAAGNSGNPCLLFIFS